MDIFFLVLLVGLLLIFGYAQLQKGVVKTSGQITLSEQDEKSSLENHKRKING